MRTSDGFILPLMLILLMVMSLLLLPLYQAESKHSAVFAALKSRQTFESEQLDALNIAKQANVEYQDQAPTPLLSLQLEWHIYGMPLQVKGFGKLELQIALG